MTLDSRSLRTISLGGRIVKVPDTSELANYTTAEDFDSSAEPVRSDAVRRVSVASLANPATELAAYAGDSVGALLVAYKTDAATNEFTLYSWDSADSGGADVPYVVAGSSGYWVACGGRYVKSASLHKGNIESVGDVKGATLTGPVTGNVITTSISSGASPADIAISCGTGKTPTFSPSIWDDLRVPMENTRVSPTKSEPLLTAFIDGTYLYAFKPTNAADESLHFVAQLPHGYKLGTNLYPHVHWSPSTTDTGNVEWELEYLIADIGGTFPGTASAATAIDAADGTVGKHQLTSLTTIDGSGITSVSAMIVCRLTRRADLGTDTFTGSAFVLEFDFHYEIDTIGSRAETTK